MSIYVTYVNELPFRDQEDHAAGKYAKAMTEQGNGFGLLEVNKYPKYCSSSLVFLFFFGYWLTANGKKRSSNRFCVFLLPSCYILYIIILNVSIGFRKGTAFPKQLGSTRAVRHSPVFLNLILPVRSEDVRSHFCHGFCVGSAKDTKTWSNSKSATTYSKLPQVSWHLCVFQNLKQEFNSSWIQQVASQNVFSNLWRPQQSCAESARQGGRTDRDSIKMFRLEVKMDENGA